MNRRLSLHVGINDYPGAPLQGCVNDARDWEALCRDLGYHTTTLLNGDATRLRILETLEGLIAQARFGDRIVFTYSGHGSWIPDTSGDEPDGRDEVLCAVDFDRGGLINDDDIQRLVQSRRFGVRITIVSDSCHSGSVNRFAQPTPRLAEMGLDRRVRFLPPVAFLHGEAFRAAQRVEARAITAPRLKSGSVLFSGCDDEEYSYDAFIDGKFNGAFTHYALRARREMVAAGGPITYNGWHRRTRSYLDGTGDFPQTPQLYATPWQKTWRL